MAVDYCRPEDSNLPHSGSCSGCGVGNGRRDKRFFGDGIKRGSTRKAEPLNVRGRYNPLSPAQLADAVNIGVDLGSSSCDC